MALSGEAKKKYQREYMREYMRKRRTGEPKAATQAAAPSTDRSAATKPNTGDGTARIRELEAELARERQEHAATRRTVEAQAKPDTNRLKELTQENLSLKQQLRDALARIPKTQRPRKEKAHALTMRRLRA